MGIEVKTLGMLIDELFTTNTKCWFAQERVMGGITDKEIAKAAKDAQNLNIKRNQLIRAIDERLGESGISVTGKTYDKSGDK